MVGLLYNGVQVTYLAAKLFHYGGQRAKLGTLVWRGCPGK